MNELKITPKWNRETAIPKSPRATQQQGQHFRLTGGRTDPRTPLGPQATESVWLFLRDILGGCYCQLYLRAQRRASTTAMVRYSKKKDGRASERGKNLMSSQ